MRLVSKALFGMGLTVAVIAIGCGGSVTGGGGGAQGSGGSAGGGGSGGSGGAGGTGGGGGSGGTGGAPLNDAGPAVCPDSPPTPGSTCDGYLSSQGNKAGFGPSCEYGDSPNPDCNDAFECGGSGPPVWTKTPSLGACPAPSAKCPGSYPGVDKMEPKCAADGLSCEYPQGFCVCSSDPGGLPTTGGPLWSCSSPGKDCPAKRPLLGSSCTSLSPTGDSTEPGPVCDYGSCSGGVAEQCTGWYWQLVQTACPA